LTTAWIQLWIEFHGVEPILGVIDRNCLAWWSEVTDGDVEWFTASGRAFLTAVQKRRNWPNKPMAGLEQMTCPAEEQLAEAISPRRQRRSTDGTSAPTTTAHSERGRTMEQDTLDRPEPTPIPCPGGCGHVWRYDCTPGQPDGPAWARRTKWFRPKRTGLCDDCRSAAAKPEQWPPPEPAAWVCAGPECEARLPYDWLEGPWDGPKAERGRWEAPELMCALCASVAEAEAESRLSASRRASAGLGERMVRYSFQRYAELLRDGTFVPRDKRAEISAEEFSAFQSGLPEWTLGITPWNRTAALRLRRFTEGEDKRSAVVSGAVGTGKSTLIAAAIGDLVDQGRESTYIAERELLRNLSNNPRHRRMLVGRLARIQVLALDDLGAIEDPKPWYLDSIEELVADRYDRRLPVLITTNRTIDQIADTYGDRVASRLVEMTGRQVTEIDGPDWRTGEMRTQNPEE
jgi:hypothetical protein